MAKPNPVVKAWKYMSAWFGSKIDEKADPKIQIQQAIQEAEHQHQQLTQQAAAVIGNQRQLEMQLNRQLGQIETLQAQARQALVLADQAKADGDDSQGCGVRGDRAGTGQPVGQRGAALEDLKTPHDQALQAAAQASDGGAGQQGAAAAAVGRAHQTAHPARAGQDAGDRVQVAAADE